MNSIYALLIGILFTTSCANLDFVYKNNNRVENPIYNKTKISFSGKDLTSAYIVIPEIIGAAKEVNYELFLNIDEIKTRRSVQNNQAVTKVDYKIKFNYNLYSIKSKCYIYRKEINSRFSYVPKSSGYNFGSDKSLDNKYELAVRSNLKEFIDAISSQNSFNCINES